MSLQEKLDAQRNQFESSVPPEALTIMHRSTGDLIRTGIMKRVLKVGDKAPEFSLPDQDGILINSSELLGEGPLVVNFYRGVW